MLGDTTYNNVYGNATTGDITRSMRAAGMGAAGEGEGKGGRQAGREAASEAEGSGAQEWGG